uniref:Ribonuclease 3 (RNase III)) n=1 Tax=Ganoderma boninense TaxID=34458 RepID=A0A5K1JS19_9APHY|nr:Ribonuclease 3 (EC (Ribonuclease III) (RNase III) [Ganoderma boninense]
MAVLSLPLTFSNSFWSEDYRKGLEVLYAELEKGIAENTEIAKFIRQRAAAELTIGATLKADPPPDSVFERDDGASLLMTFKGMRDESAVQGTLHESVAKELQGVVVEPFEKWATGHKERLLTSKANILDGYIYDYEINQAEVTKLKNDYLNKTRKADEAEDDARFAPITHPVGDQYTSPRLKPLGANPAAVRTPQRQATMSERITARLKEFRLNASTGVQQPPAKPDVQFDADEEEKRTPKVDKGKGRASDVGSGSATPQRTMSPPPLDPPMPPAKVAPPKLETDPLPPPPPPPMDIAGILMPPAEVTALLKKAKEELPLRPVRFPLLGEYQDCFSGEEFASWLKDNIKALNDNPSHAEIAGRVLTEKYNLLRRLGELGNDFENTDDAFYQFRPRAFNLDAPPTVGAKTSASSTPAQVLTPIEQRLTPLAQNVAARTGGFASLVSKAFSASGEPVHVRARREADNADKEYRTAVRKLDRQRLGLEERMEETLKTLQKWELDRLRAVKTVLTQYHAAVVKLSGNYKASSETVETLVAAYQPEQDIKVLIERYRTGPFRPVAQVYESISHDESDVVFGIDLRRWADGAYWNAASPGERKEELPPILLALLGGLEEAYGRLPNDMEKRKTWIYEVPLPAVHHLRETLNAVPPEEDVPHDLLQKYDAPVLASGVKLWALELDPPLCMYEGWDELRKVYPTVGSNKGDAKPSDEQHIQDVQAALLKLPKIHLFVLDALIKHLKNLIKSTSESEAESNEVYITKLALSMGRTILRPKQENNYSIQDRHPTLLFMDLVNKYDQILPPAILKKKRESDRKVPVRRRTRPVDMRMSRSRISAGADLKELHVQQLQQRGIKVNKTTASVTSQSPPPSTTSHSNLPRVPESPAQAINGSTTVHDEPQSFTAEPEEFTIPPPPAPRPGDIALSDNRSNIPPPPPLPTQTATPPPSAPAPPAGVPAFKEPPPETDDLPPRPQFKEPPPEPETPTRPAHFAEPPAEDLPAPAPVAPTAIPASLRRASSPRATAPGGSRSPSPSKSITGATGGATGLRGPRLSRGPRPPGAAASPVHRQFAGRPGSPGSPPGSQGVFPSSNGGGAGANLRRAGSGTRAMSKRSSISRVSELSRRTMASDAEDDIIQ